MPLCATCYTNNIRKKKPTPPPYSLLLTPRVCKRMSFCMKVLFFIGKIKETDWIFG